MSYERPRIINVKGRAISIAHLELPLQPQTLSLADVAATGTSWTVLDNSGFSNTQLILIGELGVETTEIKRVNGAVSAGTTLTLTAATFAHPAGTPLRRVLFNQWKIYGNTTNTTSGATLVATVDMDVSAPYTLYVNSGTEYNYYFVLPYDSLNTVTGDTYSDGVSNSTAYSLNSVGGLINSALDGAKARRGGIITDEWLMREINDCLRYITGKLKRWSFLQNFNYSLGAVLRGVYQFTVPTDIEDPNSNKSIIAARLGTEKNLIYCDKREWNEKMLDTAVTTVRTQAASGSTTLEITNSYDFADSGSVHIYVNGTQYTVTYTSVTRSTTAGVLNGIPASGTGSISVTIPVNTNVWQNEQEGVPTWFRVDDGILYVYPLADSSNDNFNLFIDYYTARTVVDSAADTIEGSRYDAVKHWLIWKLRSQNNASGKLDMKDGDKQMFDVILSDLIRREVSGQKFKMKPRVNTIDYGATRPPQSV